MNLALLRSLLASAVLAVSAAAQCPEWSDAFRPGGLNGDVRAFEVHDSGDGPELIAGGAFDRAGGEPSGSVVRWTGERWERLGSGLTGTVTSFARYDAGDGLKLYAGGTQLVGGASLAVWDGVVWSAVPAVPSGTIRALTVFDGWLYIAGGVWPSDLGRWNGTLYTGFGGVLWGHVNAMVVHDDGSGPALYLGGTFDYAGGVFSPRIARWSGTSWSGLNVVPMIYISALGVHDFGNGPRLVAAGSSSGVDQTARLENGHWWPMPGLSANAGSYGIGQVLYSTGSGPGAELYVGGVRLTVAGGGDGNIARWNGAAWGPVGSGFRHAGVQALVQFDSGSGPRLYAGGHLALAGDVSVDNVAAWDGIAWAPTQLGNAIGVTDWIGVRALARFDDGSGEQLYAGGSFKSAGNVAVNSIARWNGVSWSSIGHAGEYVEALCAFDDGTGPALYAAGNFNTIGGVPAERIARWNGSTWSALPKPDPAWNLRPSKLIVHDDGSGPALYAVGLIGIDGVAWAFAARWRDGGWSMVGETKSSCSIYPTLEALAVHTENGESYLYAAGRGLPGGCADKWGVLRWDGSTWSEVGGPFQGSTFALITSLASHDDGDGPALYAAGRFTSAGGIAASNVARWRKGVWSAVGSGTDGLVFDLTSFDEGLGTGAALLVSGEFEAAGGAPATRLARWHAGAWSEYAGGIHGATASSDATVTSLLVHGDGSSRSLYVGGNFARAGDQDSGSVAQIDACGETGRTYCFGDGSATACPCGNASDVGDRAGCLHSFGSGGTLRARGEASLSNDTLRIDGASMPNSAALYFQGMTMTNGGLGVPFGDGIKCTNGPFVRLLTKINASGESVFPDAGDPSVSIKGLVSSPGTRHYQVRYRNAASFCSSETFNYTNAVELVWRP